MAMMGMIGDKAKGEAEYTKKDGRFDGAVNAATNSLNQNFGSNYVWGGLRNVGFGSSIGAAAAGIANAAGQSSGLQQTGATSPVDGPAIRASMGQEHANGKTGGLAPFGGSLHNNTGLIVPSVSAGALFSGQGGQIQGR